MLLLAAAAVVLLIGCAPWQIFSPLAARRAPASSPFRSPLAPTGQIIRQLLIESLVLAILGGLLGLVSRRGDAISRNAFATRRETF